MSTTKTKTKKPVDQTEDVSDLNTMINLSLSFTKEIENIMTVDKLTFTERSSALGTATKYFVEAVNEVAERNA